MVAVGGGDGDGDGGGGGGGGDIIVTTWYRGNSVSDSKAPRIRNVSGTRPLDLTHHGNHHADQPSGNERP